MALPYRRNFRRRSEIVSGHPDVILPHVVATDYKLDNQFIQSRKAPLHFAPPTREIFDICVRVERFPDVLEVVRSKEFREGTLECVPKLLCWATGSASDDKKKHEQQVTPTPSVD